MTSVKCLFLAANPAGMPRLSLDREIREITAKIRSSEYRDALQLVSEWVMRPDDLLQMLNVHKPQIVHFSGHGTAAGEIVLVDDNGIHKPVSIAAIRALFTTLKDNLRLVILNACYAETQARAITEVIDCAIGMDEAISDEAAITFIASFYRALGFGRSIQEAFDRGVTALMLAGIPNVSTPRLLMRVGVHPESIVLVRPVPWPEA
jgi:CHAT domain-containing protein